MLFPPIEFGFAASFVQVRAAVLCHELEENQSAILSNLEDAGDSDSNEDEDEQMVVEVEVPKVRGKKCRVCQPDKLMENVD